MPSGAAQRTEIDRRLVLGASLHWAAMAVTMLPLAQAGAGADGTDWVRTAAGMLICLACALGARPFERAAFRRGVALVSAAGSLLVLAMTLGVPEPSPALRGVGQVFQSLSICPLVLLWGLAFASLDKRAAGEHVILTSGVATALILGGLLALRLCPSAGPFLEAGLRLASALALARGQDRSATRVRSFRREQAPAFARFLAGRALIGLAIGLWAATLTAVVTPVPAACAAGALLAVAATAVLWQRGGTLFSTVPVLPLWFVGAFSLAALGFATREWLASCLAAVPALCWTCWIVVSSFQVSSLKETFGMGEARLCFLEKAVILAGWLLGTLLAPLAQGAGAGLADGAPWAAATAYAVVTWATYASFRTMYSRRESELVGRLEASREERRQRVLDEIGGRYGLTSREREVMVMLAQGYTRPYICQTLGISDGTARAHASHVYQKLGIHKKDDLLELVQRVELEQEAR